MRFAAALTLAAATVLGAVAATDGPASPSVVHEWGTFTSIAGPEGQAVAWTPQTGSSDLPCFVVRNRFNIKGNIRGTVRMETPVIYFYAPGETRADVRVRFNGGVVTEWFPPASVATDLRDNTESGGGAGSIRWASVAVQPGFSPDFPVEPGVSHYYQARATDAAPVVSGGERERFLFYRGVGTFAPPIAAAVSGDGSVLVTGRTAGRIGDVVMFENRGGAIASTILSVDGDRAVIAPAAPQPEGSLPLAGLEQLLIANGLFEREAHAMVETWRDSWFEEGARLIYIVPRAFVDSILPLDIRPAPAAVVRVFVGRIELVTPETLRVVSEAMRNGDRDVLQRYGRFLEPIAQRLGVRTAAGVPVDTCTDR
jgi:hypothetical protein